MAGKGKKKSFLLILIFLIGFFTLGGFLLLPWFKNMLSNWAREKVIAYVADNSDYNLKIDSLSFEGFSGVKLHKVRFQNKLGKEEFNSKNEYQTDWMKFEINSISLTGIAWKDWLSDKSIKLKEVVIQQPTIYVYRDKRKPRAPYNVKPLPAFYLRRSKQNLTVPLITIHQGTVYYEEEVSSGVGQVSFTQLETTLQHFSNDSNYTLENPRLIMDAKALFLDSVKVEVIYKAEIKDKDDNFTLSGNIGKFQANIMNRFLEPLAKARVKSGVIHDLRFDFKADKDKAIGNLELKYDDLEIEVMKKDEPSEKAKLKSMIANIFIKDENLKNEKKSEYRKGKIEYKRKKDFSVFNYWLNAVKSGVFEIVTEVEVKKIQKK